jgi:hypothetical protein
MSPAWTADVSKTYPILAVLFTVTACGGSVVETAADAPPPPNKQQLADELRRTSLEQALEQREHFSPLCDSDGYPLPGNINNKRPSQTSVAEFCNALGQPPAPAPSPSTEPKPESPPPQQNPAPSPPAEASACDLKALNQELSNVMPETALKEHEHFRCLCDDQGYPLVGNINAKGTKASDFCKTIRDKGLL